MFGAMPPARAPGGRSEGERAPPPGRRKTILFVDDNDLVREVVRAVLEDDGYAVVEARSAEEALAVAGRHDGPIELLLTDLLLPGLGGRELADRLVSLRGGVKVLYTSAHVDDALGPGAAFILKPFGADALIRKVREVLDS